MFGRALVIALLLPFVISGLANAQEKKEGMKRAKLPNILWITSEDHGPHMGCYGDAFARTPNVDKLARKGMIFRMCWSNAPVCAPARTTIISGLYPTSTGSEHMRSLTRLPARFMMFPRFLRALGYCCTNKVKEDYNLEKTGQVWDDSSNKAHWKNRGEGQPFFAVFNSVKSHESAIQNYKALVGDPGKVRVPVYHPDTKEVRDDWTRYYDIVSKVDGDAGELLRELEEAGLLEDTIVFYYADHGAGMPRSKRTPLDSGLHVPLVLWFPERWRHLAPAEYQPGGASSRLVSFVDLAPTMLSIAGVEPPDWMQGHAFAGKHCSALQPLLHGFRGRMDERYDLQRSVTDGRHVYLRNYMPHLPAGQHVDYMFLEKSTRVWHKLFEAGKLNAVQSLFWQSPRATEELYDLQADPDEVKNLAASPTHAPILEKLRKAQHDHALAIRDVGLLPEDEIHSRSANSTPYEMGHDPKKFPLERILLFAELASSRQAAALPRLKEGLADEDSAVRYWAALGLLMQGKDAALANNDSVVGLLKDRSPSVRVVAAETLAQFGAKADAVSAIKVLADLGHPQKNSFYVRLAALNALDRLGPRAASASAEFRAWPAKGAPAGHRAAAGIPHLITRIQSQIGS